MFNYVYYSWYPDMWRPRFWACSKHRRVWLYYSPKQLIFYVMFLEFIVSMVRRAAYAHRSLPLIRGAQKTGRLKFIGVCCGNLHTFTKPGESGRLLSKQIQTNTEPVPFISLLLQPYRLNPRGLTLTLTSEQQVESWVSQWAVWTVKPYKKLWKWMDNI